MKISDAYEMSKQIPVEWNGFVVSSYFEDEYEILKGSFHEHAGGRISYVHRDATSAPSLAVITRNGVTVSLRDGGAYKSNGEAVNYHRFKGLVMMSVDGWAIESPMSHGNIKIHATKGTSEYDMITFPFFVQRLTPYRLVKGLFAYPDKGYNQYLLSRLNSADVRKF